MTRQRLITLAMYCCLIGFLGLSYAALVTSWTVWGLAGNALADGQEGIWRVVDARAPISICALQGQGFTSPYSGRVVTTRGVVYADLDEASAKGFFIQDESCDGDETTSNGLFVALGFQIDLVSAGDQVEVSGVVREHYGQTELAVDPDQVRVLSAGHPLPLPVELAPPANNLQARHYFEALEGMRVTLGEGRVVGPTSAYGETWLVRRDLGLERVYQDDPLGTGEVITVGERGLFRPGTPARVGDLVGGLDGALAFVGGAYQLALTAPVTQDPQAGVESLPDGPTGWTPGAATSADAFAFEVATFNLHNLFDTVDDPGVEDPRLSSRRYNDKLAKLALAIHTGLQEPTLIGVQEVEKGVILEDLLLRPEIEADYGYVWVDGPDRRGIDVALLYRRDRALALSHNQYQGCTRLVDGLGPDGNQDVSAPQNQVTCDTDGDGVLDGNRLFSRPPLLVHLQVCAARCPVYPGAPPVPTVDVWVLVAHLKSKFQDTAWVAYTLPRRLLQAQFLRGLVEGIQAAHPRANLIVLGDFNDHLNSAPLQALAGPQLWNLMPWLDRSQRYTYIHQGVSQVLDHVLVSAALLEEGLRVQVPHINADFPAAYENDPGLLWRSSDHEPVVVQFTVLPHRFFLPRVAVSALWR